LVKLGGGRITCIQGEELGWMKLDKSELVRFEVLKAMVADHFFWDVRLCGVVETK
jgi:hypothetical protein